MMWTDCIDGSTCADREMWDVLVTDRPCVLYKVGKVAETWPTDDPDLRSMICATQQLVGNFLNISIR